MVKETEKARGTETQTRHAQMHTMKGHLSPSLTDGRSSMWVIWDARASRQRTKDYSDNNVKWGSVRFHECRMFAYSRKLSWKLDNTKATTAAAPFSFQSGAFARITCLYPYAMIHSKLEVRIIDLIGRTFETFIESLRSQNSLWKALTSYICEQ